MKSILWLSFFLLLPMKVHAETCPLKPTCSELGYILSTEDCAGYKMLRCPFDFAQVFCHKTKADSTYLGKNCSTGDTFSTNLHRCTAETEVSQDYIYIEEIEHNNEKMALTLMKKENLLSQGSYIEALETKDFQTHRLITKKQLQKIIRYFLLHFTERCVLTQDGVFFVDEASGELQNISSETDFEKCYTNKEQETGSFYDLRTAKLVYEPL